MMMVRPKIILMIRRNIVLGIQFLLDISNELGHITLGIIENIDINTNPNMYKITFYRNVGKKNNIKFIEL